MENVKLWYRIGIVAAAVIGLWLLIHGCNRQRERREVERIAEENDKAIKSTIAFSDETRKNQKNMDIELEARKLVQEREQQRIKLEEERSAKVQQAWDEEKRKEKEAGDRREVESRQKEIADAKASLDKAIGKLKSVKFLPIISFSARLRQLGATWELRGKYIKEVQKALQEQDWDALVQLTQKLRSTENSFPGREMETEDMTKVRSYNFAYEELTQADYPILLKTTSPLTVMTRNDNHDVKDALYFVSYIDDLPILEKGGLLVSDVPYSWDNHRWEKHPDGAGYLHEHRLSEPREISVYIGATGTGAGSKTNELSGKLYRMEREYQTTIGKWRQQLELGELTADQATQSVKELRNKVRQTLQGYLDQY